ALDSHIYGFTLQELNFPFSSEEIPEAAKALLPLAPADQYPYLSEMGTHVIESDYDGVVEFEFGLDLVLDGLERLLEAR
ncbi:MAG: TetR/AcrR family transcriptional regulator C-terminal domain-containing protein, partial [Actinomycetota bacterium]|nr:TetR/AcrR family transcriptional regulator C-terminal domain-containing protein [Actinomycetota bacterium]